jgi:hypothetical protein
MLDNAAGHAVPVKFAVTKEQAGARAELGRQRYYDQGCTIVASFGTAADGRTFLVLLQNNAGPTPLDHGAADQVPVPNPQLVPNKAFQSLLTQG